MRVTVDELRQRWRPEPGSKMAALLDQLTQHEGEHARLKDLLARRQTEFAAVQGRLNHPQADADPLTVAQDRLLLGVLPEMIVMLKGAISTASSEVSKVRSLLDNMGHSLGGKQAETAQAAYLMSPHEGQPQRVFEGVYTKVA